MKSLGDVYFKKLFPMGVDAMIEGLELVRAGVRLKHAQNLADGSYESWFKKDLAEINWAKPVAGNLQPDPRRQSGARRLGHDKGPEGRHLRQRQGRQAVAQPGEVLAIDGQGMTIAAGDGAILAKRVRGSDGKKVAAAEWAKSAGVNAGDSFEKPAAPKATT